MLILGSLPMATLAVEIDSTAGIAFKGENPYKPPVVTEPPIGDSGNGNGQIIGRLPQTGTTSESFLLIIGTTLIALAIGLNYKNQKKGRETK